MSRKNPKLTILVGVSLSGKSTWAKQYCKENPGTYIVSRDTERESLFGTYRMGSNQEEEMINEICKEKTLTLLSNKKNVILDNTHLKLKYINSHINDFNYLADIEIRVFDYDSLEVLNKRNIERAKGYPEKFIPLKVLANQITALEVLSIPKQTYERQRWSYKPQFNDELPYAFIFDLDGTLANGVHRDPFSPKDEEVLQDKPILSVLSVHQPLFNAFEVIYLSGREDKYKEVTEDWLEKHTGNKVETLIMRKTGDHRPDDIVKRELFNQYIKDKFNVLGVFDDRDKVVKMWQREGIFVFDVSQGKGRF